MEFIVVYVGFIILFSFMMFVAAIAGLVFWIFMLIDVLQRKNWPEEDQKVLWIVIILLAGVIGAIMYYFMVRKKLDKVTGQSALPPTGQSGPPAPIA